MFRSIVAPVLFAFTMALPAKAQAHEWQQQLGASVPGSSGYGEVMAVSDDTLLVGAPYENAGAGAVYVYTRSAAGWVLQTQLVSSAGASAGNFGIAVAIEGDTAVVGAHRESDGTYEWGAAYVFTRSGAAWSETVRLEPLLPRANSEFGRAVAIDGDRVLVGAPRENGSSTGANGNPHLLGSADSGAAYLFERDAQGWHLEAYLKASFAQSSLAFGGAVDLDDDLIVLGAVGAMPPSGAAANCSGAVFAFKRNLSWWTGPAVLQVSTANGLGNLGRSVAVEGGVVVAGADGDAFVFERTSVLPPWWLVQQHLHVAGGAVPHVSFGGAVAMRDGVLVVCADAEPPPTTVPNPRGACHVYLRQNGTWLHRDRISHPAGSPLSALWPSIDVGRGEVFVRSAAPSLVHVFATCYARWAAYGETWSVFPAPGISADDSPVLGAAVGIRLWRPAAPTCSPALVALGFESAEIDLGAVGLQGTLLVQPAVYEALVVCGSSAAYSLAIPADPLMCGVELFAQGVLVDPGLLGSISLTRGVRLTLGL